MSDDESFSLTRRAHCVSIKVLTHYVLSKTNLIKKKNIYKHPTLSVRGNSSQIITVSDLVILLKV